MMPRWEGMNINYVFALPLIAGEEMQLQHMHLGRRSKLPMPKPEADVSLWSLLCKNIGKDLSKISMPVTLNEPLNMLQVCPLSTQ